MPIARPATDARGRVGSAVGRDRTLSGVALEVTRLSPDTAGTGERLVLLHGFTQNARCWGRFGDELTADPPDGLEVLAVDLPGHGRSGHDDADLPCAAALVADAAGAGVYLGYSLGGRVALHAALARPDLVRGLVLIGATAGIDDPDERAARRRADAALADRLLADGLPTFLDRWLAGPLFADLDPADACRAERLSNRPAGLAASLRNCGTGTQEPLWDRLEALTMPLLIVVGERDEKFSALGRRLVGAATGTTAALVSIPGTHAVHLEQPAATAAAVARHLGTGRPGGPA